jgi:hypothetical protein
MLAVRAEQFNSRRGFYKWPIARFLESQFDRRGLVSVAVEELKQRQFKQEEIDAAERHGMIHQREDGLWELASPSSTTAHFVYALIDPLPISLLTPEQGKVEYLQKQFLNNLKDYWLSLDDLLNCVPWDGKKQHGLRPREGLLLQAYAEEINFPREQWPVWLTRAHQTASAMPVTATKSKSVNTKPVAKVGATKSPSSKPKSKSATSMKVRGARRRRRGDSNGTTL